MKKKPNVAQLLCHVTGPRCAIVVHDFAVTESFRSRIVSEFSAAGFATAWRDLTTPMHDWHSSSLESVSASLIFGLITRHDNLPELDRLHLQQPTAAVARLELPCPDLGFATWQADEVLDVVFAADYLQQRLAADLFYNLLGQRQYVVQVHTRDSTLAIHDDRSWFDLSGPLASGEKRILPGGEVAYTGDAVSGRFCVDGGLLATPVRPGGTERAARLTRLSATLREYPLSLTLREGQVISLRSDGPHAAQFEDLLGEPFYRTVTEVGVSFNGACSRLEHAWPCAANEGYPGVHIGLGGDPEAAQEMPEAGVHVDLIAHSVEVSVNGRAFFCRR